MVTGKVLNRKPHAGNQHEWIAKGGLAVGTKPRVGARLYRTPKGRSLYSLSVLVSVAVGVLVSFAAIDGDTSDSAFVFVKPDTSSFWHTATNNMLSVPIDFPAGVSSAKLTVLGAGYSAIYENISEPEYAFTLPMANSPNTENVYDLVLTFSDGTVRRARIGLVQGQGLGDTSSTRCLLPGSGRQWEKVSGRAVMPIPYGVSSVIVDGVATDTMLGGVQGWFVLDGVVPRQTVPLAFAVHGEEFTATVRGVSSGMNIVIK